MRVFHGTAAWACDGVAGGRSIRFGGLYITDTPERAQLYADSRATHFDTSRKIRRVAGSVLVEIETDESIVWSRRPEGHPTLDQCEATIRSWRVVQATAYARQYDLTHSMHNLGTRRDPRYVRTYDHLRELFGGRLAIVLVEECP